MAAWVVLLLAAVIALSIPIGFLAAPHHETFSWEVASVFGTALGTTALAGFTAALAFTTSGDVRATWELAQLTREDQAARERPIIIVRGRWWEPRGPGQPPEPDGWICISVMNVGLGPALDLVVEARFTRPPSGTPLDPEPEEFMGGLVTVALPGERYTLRLGVTFPGDTPEWASNTGVDVRGTFTDRKRSQRYDLDGNEVTDADRSRWLPPGTRFVGAVEERFFGDV